MSSIEDVARGNHGVVDSQKRCGTNASANRRASATFLEIIALRDGDSFGDSNDDHAVIVEMILKLGRMMLQQAEDA